MERQFSQGSRQNCPRVDMMEAGLYKEFTDPLLATAEAEAEAEEPSTEVSRDGDEYEDLFPDLELLLPETSFTLSAVLRETGRLLRRHYKTLLIPSLLPAAQIILSLVAGYWRAHIWMGPVLLVHFLLWCLALTAFPRAIAGAYLEESPGPVPVARKQMLLELEAGRFLTAFSRNLAPQFIYVIAWYSSYDLACFPYFIAWWPIGRDCPAVGGYSFVFLLLLRVLVVESFYIMYPPAAVLTSTSTGWFRIAWKPGWTTLWLSLSTAVPPVASLLLLQNVDARYRLAAFVVLLLWRYQWAVCWHVIRTVLFLMCKRQDRLPTTLA